MKTFKLPIIILTAIIAINGCKKDKDEVETPPIVNEEEVITTVKLMFTDIGGVAPATEAVFRDPVEMRRSIGCGRHPRQHRR